MIICKKEIDRETQEKLIEVKSIMEKNQRRHDRRIAITVTATVIIAIAVSILVLVGG